MRKPPSDGFQMVSVYFPCLKGFVILGAPETQKQKFRSSTAKDCSRPETHLDENCFVSRFVLGLDSNLLSTKRCKATKSLIHWRITSTSTAKAPETKTNVTKHGFCRCKTQLLQSKGIILEQFDAMVLNIANSTRLGEDRWLLLVGRVVM